MGNNAKCGDCHPKNTNTMEEIEKILVLVKMKDGTIRQVISNQSQKELALRMMIGEDGKIHLNHTPELGISF